MRVLFEVRAKDLLGRLGRVRIGGKSIETPSFVPVINPISQIIPAREIKQEFGCEIVITNSYILYRRLREEVAERGVHSIIGFDGVVMTDSGGYQVLEYGGVDAGPVEIALFQESIGTDVAIPLDKPTGVVGRVEALATVEQTLANVRETIRALGDSRRCAWAAPIQGGIYADLVRRCAEELSEMGFFDLYALGSPTPLMQNYQYDKLMKMMAVAKLALPVDRPLHLFGAGHPMMFAFAAALGYDTFDSASYVLFAREGRYMLDTRTVKLEKLEYLPCECKACRGVSVRELRSMEHRERTRLLAYHNLSVCFREVALVKQAIAEGRLFELLELRARGHPALMQALHYLMHDDKTLSAMEAHTPINKPRALALYDSNSLARPETRRAAKRLAVISLNPYSRTRAVMIPQRIVTTKKLEDLLTRLRERVNMEEAILLTYYSPFGAVPLPLARTYPFSQVIYPSSLLSEDIENNIDRVVDVLRRSKVSEILLVKWRREPPEWFVKTLKERIAGNLRDVKAEIVEI